MHRTNSASGFTLVEIIIVAGLIASLSMIAVPRLLGYAQRNKDQQAIVDITKISTEITHYIMDYSVPPDSLADVGFGGLLDPWGRPYEYLKIIDNTDPGINGKRRKDHSLVPVNSDYDLYSRGADGLTGAPFTDKKSRDDIVRASNGAYIGPVSEF
ncbi:MAG: prepilin-type N-terminal cleavage/methylation domain-containing protein [Thermoanaerobaculales bacterium]|nr:prepilin-type N-terminal cleavage/methylation domain-containing protein [Thermoanaerobaculales bacterium]